MKRYLSLLLLAFTGIFLNYSFVLADAVKGQAVFNDTKVGNCKSCHDTGDKKKVGPGLKGITERASKDWLTKWLEDTKAVWDANDSYTQDLKKRVKKEGKPKSAHKTPVKLSAEQITDVIDYLATLK
ncbi:MAG: cytochrome c [Nitrospinae bacterium]|nr:cytochrome c [Nitrospinota bacterium]